MGQRWIWLSKMPLFPRIPLDKKKALQPSFFCDIMSLMETKIDDNKASGFVWYVLCIVAVTTVWRSYNTLPAEFLLGAFSVWCLRNGMFYYEKASKIENE